jgi:hypothetical protein
MNLLISKLLHWFLFSGTLFFAAGAVAEPAAAAAPAAAPAAAEPAAPAAPAAEPSIADIVKESATEAAQELTKPAEAAQPGAEAAKPATEAAKPVAEPAKPAAEAAKPAADPAKPAEAAPAPNPLDKLGPLPAEKITAALAEAPPEVQQFLKDKGLSVESLTANARMAAEGVQYKERFPTVEAADTALDGAKNFWTIEDKFGKIQSGNDPENFNGFMAHLAELSFERDAKGAPIPDPDNPGAFKNDGSVARLIDNVSGFRDTKIGELADMMLKAAQSDEAKAYATDLKGAIEFLGNFVKNGYKMPGEKKEAPKYTPEDQARLDRADRMEKESRERESSTQQQAFNQKEDRILDLTTKAIEPTIQAALDKSAFTPELKTLITETVWNKLVDQVLKNDLYRRERDSLSPAAPDYEQRRVALNKSYMQERVVKIIESVVGQLGGPVVDANKARHTKLDSQSEAARMDPKTSGITLQSHPAAATTDQVHAKAMEMAKAENPGAREGGPEYWKAVLKLDTP